MPSSKKVEESSDVLFNRVVPNYISSDDVANSFHNHALLPSSTDLFIMPISRFALANMSSRCITLIETPNIPLGSVKVPLNAILF